MKIKINYFKLRKKSKLFTSGSGVYNGLDGCLMYCVEWKTRKAKPARKSRDDNKPATGRNVKPVQSFKKLEISSNCGMLSSR